MAQLIRRRSMEHLELYDLDELKLNPSAPELRSICKHPHHRRSSVNTTYDRYQFLCNTKRTQMDPIYAATPMFTTIPRSSDDEYDQTYFSSSIKSVSHSSSKSNNNGIIEEDKEIEDGISKDFKEKLNYNETELDGQSNYDQSKRFIQHLFNRK